jgi:hypothetical protein
VPVFVSLEIRKPNPIGCRDEYLSCAVVVSTLRRRSRIIAFTVFTMLLRFVATFAAESD